MNNFKFVERIQTLQQRVSEFADQLQAEALKLVFLDQLVQINVQQLKDDAHVVPKHEIIEPKAKNTEVSWGQLISGSRYSHVNDVESIFLVLPAEMFQDANLLLRLPMEALLVPYHLQRDMLAGLVVVRFDDLPEASLADDLQHLVAIGDVVMWDVNVRAVLVVVVGVVRPRPGAFLRVSTNEVNL